MNLGILTFHWAYNYGALLQAHGLAQVLRSSGHKIEFINYAPPGLRLAWWQGWGIRSGKHMPARALWRLRFDRFRRRYLPESRPCLTRDDLKAVARKYDAVIVGSDQVWNGNIFNRFDPVYYLDFIKDGGCRRISYGACFGDPHQPSETLSKGGELLRDFDSLSVRNECSAALVESLSGRRPQLVLDPTLLHDYAEFLYPRQSRQPYIAVYYLSNKHFFLGLQVLKTLKHRLGLPSILISADVHSTWADKNILSAGPIQWIQILNESSFICTDSFHGTVFATKLKKPFIAWSGFRPERIKDFLTRSGINDRLIYQPNTRQIDHLVDNNIDFELAADLLAPQISSSIQFLKDSLSC